MIVASSAVNSALAAGWRASIGEAGVYNDADEPRPAPFLRLADPDRGARGRHRPVVRQPSIRHARWTAGAGRRAAVSAAARAAGFPPGTDRRQGADARRLAWPLERRVLRLRQLSRRVPDLAGRVQAGLEGTRRARTRRSRALRFRIGRPAARYARTAARLRRV